MVDYVCDDSSTATEDHRKKLHRLLMLNGFKIIEKCDVKNLAVSNTHAAIKKLLKDSHWSIRWGKVLGRIDGAIHSDGPIYFGAQGSDSRAVLVPLKNKMEE